MRSISFLLTIAMTLLWSNAHGGEFNQVLSIGQTAPHWDKLPGSDGNAHSFSEFADKDAIVVAFTCLSCPEAVDYEERFNTLARKYGEPNGNVGFIAICVNRVAEDRLDKLTKRATQRQLNFVYVYDESQKIARDFGATYTPEYFVLNKQGKLTYMGAFDDAADATKVTRRYVEDALIATLKNTEPAVKETLAARGCLVRYARARSKE